MLLQHETPPVALPHSVEINRYRQPETARAKAFVLQSGINPVFQRSMPLDGASELQPYHALSRHRIIVRPCIFKMRQKRHHMPGTQHWHLVPLSKCHYRKTTELSTCSTYFLLARARRRRLSSWQPLLSKFYHHVYTPLYAAYHIRISQSDLLGRKI